MRFNNINAYIMMEKKVCFVTLFIKKKCTYVRIRVNYNLTTCVAVSLWLCDVYTWMCRPGRLKSI